MIDKRSIWDVMENLNEFIIAFAFAIVAAIIYELFHNQFLALLMLSISLLAIAAYLNRIKNVEALKGLYSFIGKSSLLKPGDMLGTRPYNPYYYSRHEDDLIDICLNNKNNVLIIGSPLAGKTRALFQALNKLNEPQRIAIPICKDINPETFTLPKNTEIIVIDDLHRFVEQQNFDHLFRVTIDSNVVIAATCRSKMEYKKVISKMLGKNILLDTIFKNIIELPQVSEYVGENIADKVEISWHTVKFDGNIGSIFMHLGEMERRFDESNDVEKTILRVIKNLYVCGICEGNLFPLDWIKIAAKKDELEVKDYEWTGLLDNLEGKEFITLEENGVQAEEVYLEDVVKLPAEIKNLDVFKKMITIFSGLSDALFKLGNRACDIGRFSLKEAEYMKIAIKAYEEAVKVYTLDDNLDDFPMQYANTQYNLGMAYSGLAEAEKKSENCKKAICASKEAILYIIDKFSLEAEYMKIAIKAYEEAVKVYTLDSFPMDYANTQNGLGRAYSKLAEAEKKSENCKKAICASKEALKVFTLDDFPMQYADTQNGLGETYRMLAEAEKKSENCKKAIKAYEEALKVFTLDDPIDPIPYALTQYNLGMAYSGLAEVEKKSENCKKAICACKEALKVFTKEEFPEIYLLVEPSLRSLVAFCQGE